MTQFSPRLTSASGSPWVATTRPFCVPTSTAQPVPQKRQGALSQRMESLPLPATLGIALGAAFASGIPALAAAAATAEILIKSRRSKLMLIAPVVRAADAAYSMAKDLAYFPETQTLKHGVKEDTEEHGDKRTMVSPWNSVGSKGLRGSRFSFYFGLLLRVIS